MAIAFGSATQNTSSADRSGTQVDTTHDVGSSADRTVVCAIFIFATSAGEPPINSVTYNGVALTERVSINNNWTVNRHIKAALYTLDNPASGSNTGSVTYGGSSFSSDIIVWFHYTGANNGVGANTGTSTGNGNHPQATFSSGASDSVNIGAMTMRGGDSDPWTPDNTERVEAQSGTDANTDITAMIEDMVATGGSDTLGGTASVTDNYAIAAFELQAAAAAAERRIDPIVVRQPTPIGLFDI